MKMINLVSLCLSVVLTACGETTPKDQKSSVDTEMPVVASQEESNPQTDPVSANYLNGINNQNKGDKSGAVHVSGTIKFPGGGEVTLYESEGSNSSEIAKTRLSNNSFDFGTIEVSRGFYKIALNNETNATNLILNPDEPEVFVDFKTGRMSAAKFAVESDENTGWFEYNQAEFKNTNEIRNLRKSIKDAGAFRARIETQIKDKELELIAIQHELIGRYPDTYLAKYLTWKNPKYATSKGRFFEDIDPMDNSVVRSMTLSNRIQTMMRSFSDGTDSGFLACIDLVKAHFEPNPVALESVLYTMLDGFYNTGKETICQYILDNYIFDEDCGADLSDAIRIRAQGIINLQVGKTPPNFNISKSDGGSLDLMATCKKNKYTLVMFWASWCHKCEQEIPSLVPVYAKFGFKGFELIGVSLDQQRSTWLGAIESNGMTWPNVSQLEAWNSPVVGDYKVTATPTYFLLDSEGTIVLKPGRYFEVEKFLSANL
jgi:thiol-disulfide isomerase/thioredoxin